MQQIIPPVAKELIKSELTPERLMRRTNRAHNEIYIITAHNAPNTMREIGRLREIAFRHYGGGTGLEVDIDAFDTMENPYRQLIVWSPQTEEILGGYRFLCGSDVQFDKQGKPILATSHLFDFSRKFVRDYLPYTVELGRSFVALDYQASLSGAKGIYTLDNLWDGLGALSVVDPNIRYFFGKVTMYSTYNVQARNMILYFLNKYFEDSDLLVYPIHALQTHTDMEQMQRLFSGGSMRADYRILNNEVRKLGMNIPPLVNAYMSLSPQMRVFGTAINREFGNVEETGILIAIHQILEDKRIRYIESFLNENPSAMLLYKLRQLIRWRRE